MATYDLRPLSFGEILDGAFSIYKTHFATLVAVAAVCVGVPAIMMVYAELGGGLVENPVLLLAAYLLWGFGGLIATAGTIYVISEAYLGREPMMADALSFALGKIWKLLAAGITKYLLIGIGFLFFIIPGLVLTFGYVVVAQVVVLENVSATGSLRRSWELTKGFKWRALGLMVVISIILMVPSMVAGYLMALAPAQGDMGLQILGQLIQVLLYPVMPCALTLYYYDLRVRKEAFDLEYLGREIGFGAEPTGM